MSILNRVLVLVLFLCVSCSPSIHESAFHDPSGIPAGKQDSTGTPDGGSSGDSPPIPLPSDYAACEPAPFSEGLMDELVSLGFVDVRRYKNDSGDDWTQAIQAAIDDAKSFGQKRAVYFPPGIYRISNTITCQVEGTDGGDSDTETCALVGSASSGPGGSSRPEIVLRARSDGFGGDQFDSPRQCDAGNPSMHTSRDLKYVLYFYSHRCDPAPSVTLGKEFGCDDPKSAYNLKLVNMHIRIEEGNPCAVAVSMRGAQGTGVQDVSIDLRASGYAGLSGGSGSGGSHIGVSVVGGEVGLDLRGAQSTPTIVGATLREQRRAALLYEGRQALVAVGLEIETHVASTEAGAAREGLVRTTPSATGHEGHISLIDSRIIFRNGRTDNVAIATKRGLYLENVHVSGAEKIVAALDGSDAVRATAGAFTKVSRLARVPTATSLYSYPYYRDGELQADDLVELEAQMGAPLPEALQGRHLPPALSACYEHVRRVIVTPARLGADTSSPSHRCTQTQGDDEVHEALQRIIDDNRGRPILLGRGTYCLERPLRVHPDTILLGVARHLAILRATPGERTLPYPVVRTEASAEAKTILAFLKIDVDTRTGGNAYGLEWMAGAGAVARSVNFGNRGANDGVARNRQPFVRITGEGGGRFYDFFNTSWKEQGSGYRHLLVEDNRSPLAIYQLNPEHARPGAVNPPGTEGPEPQVEIRNNRAPVSIFGLKAEGNYPALWIKKTVSIATPHSVRMYGHGGNATPFPGEALFRVLGMDDFLLANVVDYPPGAEAEYCGSAIFTDCLCWMNFEGCEFNPNTWVMVREVFEGGTYETGKSPAERPLLYMRM